MKRSAAGATLISPLAGPRLSLEPGSGWLLNPDGRCYPADADRSRGPTIGERNSRPASSTAFGGVVLRRLTATAMAVPVLLSIYLALAVGRSTTRRVGIGAAFVAVIGVGALMLASPSPSVSIPPTQR